VTVGEGTPLPPIQLQLTVVDKITAVLRWRGDLAAAGYRVWARESDPDVRSLNNRELKDVQTSSNARALIGKALLTDLYPSVWAFEYAVSAYNGNDESDISQWIMAPSGSTGNYTSGERLSPLVAEDDSLSITLDYTQDAVS